MSSPALIPDTLLNDPFYSRLKEHLVEATGLAYYDDKDTDFARRILYRLAILGLRDCGSYFDILLDTQRGPAELDTLIAELAIAETHFFRHSEHFEALSDLVLPDLMRRNMATRRLRIWCAGCADGAEPYSLSILTRRDFGHRLMGWDVNILATDINRRGLARAREGKFEEWSLRATPDDVKRDCFVREGKQWKLAQHYIEGVSFQYHNLVANPFPSLLSNLSSFDLIVCRNVMIYFAPDLMRRLIRQFHDSLVPGAWLLVGPAEPNMTYFTTFHTVNAPGVTLYQKPDQRTCNFVYSPARSECFATPPPLLPPAAKRADAPDPLPGQSSDGIEPTLIEIRKHLDIGEWEKAVACCEQSLNVDTMNPSVHFHRALALEQLARHGEAELSLRRAIYLDRQSALPHYYLGVLLLTRGHSRQAARSFENTVELLRSRHDSEVLADAGGITVAELKKLAQTQVEIIRGQI